MITCVHDTQTLDTGYGGVAADTALCRTGRNTQKGCTIHYKARHSAKQRVAAVTNNSSELTLHAAMLVIHNTHIMIMSSS
jgi:hypothetical protein